MTSLHDRLSVSPERSENSLAQEAVLWPDKDFAWAAQNAGYTYAKVDGPAGATGSLMEPNRT